MRHVEVHLQEISLMALPSPGPDEADEDGGSNISEWASQSRDDRDVRQISSMTLIERVQDHPVYKSAKPRADGLWHCAWEGEDYCEHEPTMLRAEFE